MTRPRVPHFGWIDQTPDASLTALHPGPADLGVDNLKIVHPSELHQQAGGELAVRIAFPDPRALDLVLVLLTNAGAGATLQLRASAAEDFSGADLYAYTGTANVDPAIGYAWHLLPTTVTARYWELRLSDPSLSAVTGGRLVLVPLVAWSKPRRLGVKKAWVDPSDGERGQGGQYYVNEKAGWRKFTFSVVTRSEAEALGVALEMERVAGKRRDVVALLDPAGAFPSQDMICGINTKVEGVDEPGLRVWSYSFEIEERRA